ncbi:MAG: MCE family protein [Burkholderiaceae bacterium]|nr:MCE family protein [Burkholderiaceae bacterium]
MTEPIKPTSSASDADQIDTALDAPTPVTPSPIVRPPQKTRISWIWFIPLLAAVVGASLLVRNWINTGPTITISFESADGLEVGQTKVRYKDVVIGVVTGIAVAPDRDKVLVSAELRPTEAEFITQEGSRFWVVRPRLGVSGVSGLGTLLSGAYISVDAATTKNGAAAYKFIGLEKPPEVTSGRPGTRFSLSASDLGSLEIGSPVYFRRIPVGRVIGYDLDTVGRAVNIQVFVDAPADQFVGADTRFWNASGIDFSLDGGGLNVRTNSLASVVAGGLAFANPEEGEFKPINPGQVFQLFNSEPLAMADPDGMPFPIELHFQQSVRGLKEGAVIDFRGLELGKVVDIDLEYNPDTQRFFALVKAQLYPLRFGAVYENLIDMNTNIDYPGQALLAPLVEHGLRAQLRASNLLTGQQYVALDFFPDATAVSFNPHQIPLVLPTTAGSFDRLQQQVSSIVTKLDGIPYDILAQEVRTSVAGLSRLLASIETQVVPSTNKAIKTAHRALSNAEAMLAKDAPVTDRLDSTLREIANAAKSLRALADYLQTNPTSLIRGPATDTLSIRP